jgi:hypothetical protein
MYCATCGTQVASGLSFCNRCGTGVNTGRDGTTGKGESGPAGSLITGVVLVAIFGLGIMFSGSIALRKGGDLDQDVVFMFMTFCFAIVGVVELFLLRQLSRVLASGTKQNLIEQQPQPLFQPAQVPASGVRAAQLHSVAESMPSVTEHTTRTLEQSRQSLK